MKVTKQVHCCDPCHICLYCSPGQWEAHLNADKHKNNVKKAARREREKMSAPALKTKRGQTKGRN